MDAIFPRHGGGSGALGGALPRPYPRARSCGYRL
jgi:hypothetical protein